MHRQIEKQIPLRHRNEYNTLYNLLTRKTAKLKPAVSKFRLDMSKDSATLNCLVCKTKLKIEDFSRAVHQEIIDSFKSSHNGC